MNKLKKLARILSANVYIRGLRHGIAAAIEHEKIVSQLSFSTLVDIGANKGQFSLMVRAHRPEAYIIAFEPMQPAAERFRALFHKDERVILHECAIGPIEGETKMYISQRDDSSSLLPITERQVIQFPGTGLERIEKIKVCRLENRLAREELTPPVLLKIDVQGYELESLKGCAELLDLIDIIIVECSFVELYEGQALAYQVIDYLHGKGFRLSGIYNLSSDKSGLPVQADFLFESSKNC